MTTLERVIHDPHEVDDVRLDARKEFEKELKERGREHLVTEQALDRWYAPRPRVTLARKIRAELGEPVSHLSIMEERARA